MRWAIVIFGLALAGCSSKPSPPQSAYADPRACASCHPQQAKTYAQTGMGRSFRKARPDDAPDTPFTHALSGRTYQFTKRDGKLFLGRTDADGIANEKEIHYVLGSGNHAKTFVHKTPQNRLLQMPVNTYPAIAMSPGYDRADHMDMRRTIGYQCLFCHNGYPAVPNASLLDDPVYPGAIPEGIDCQRCHGPGREHVEKGGAIFNPKNEPSARQLQVCSQCHLETTSFSLPNSLVRFEKPVFGYNPKEPLESFILHFDHATGHEDKFEIASSVYRLRQSACFQKSGGKMTCTTCHDPHAKKTNFDATCQQCHPSLPAKHAAKKDCATCHMPKRTTEDVVHVAMTDHKIQRPIKNALAPLAERHEVMGLTSYQGEVKPYGPSDPLYTAMAQVAHQSNLKKGIPLLAAELEKQRPQHPAYYLQMAQAVSGAAALPYYEKALALDANYLPALRSLGATQLRLGKTAEAQATLEKATQKHPNDAVAWLELARAYRQTQRPNDAATAARKAAAAEPELVEAHTTLGTLLAETGDRAGAEQAFRAALREQPDLADAHSNLGNLLTGLEAEKHFAAALRYNPKHAAARFNFALLLANQRRYPEAISHATLAVANDPANLNARDLLGNLHAAQRNWPEAARQYREALRINPQFGRGQIGLGTALGAMGDFAGARVYFGQAAQSAEPNVRGEAMEMLRSLP